MTLPPLMRGKTTTESTMSDKYSAEKRSDRIELAGVEVRLT